MERVDPIPIPDEDTARDTALAEVSAQIAGLREQLEEIKKLLRARPRSAETGFLDAKAAAAYCGMSRGTFDKYRYKTAVKIKGYRIGGKVLYKTEDLDSFIKLYELKSGGLA